MPSPTPAAPGEAIRLYYRSGSESARVLSGLSLPWPSLLLDGAGTLPEPGILVVDATPSALAAARALVDGRPDVAAVAVLAPGGAPLEGDDWVFAYLEGSGSAAVMRRTLDRAVEHLQLRQHYVRTDAALEQLSAEYLALVSIGIRLSAETDTGVLLDLILEQARAITHADAGSLYLVEGRHSDTPQLRFALVQNDSIPVTFRGATLPISPASVAGYVALTGQTLHLDDAYALPADSPFRIDRSFDDQTGYRSRSMLVVPMTTPKNEVVGVIQLINSKTSPALRLHSREQIEAEVRPFPQRFQSLASSLASQAAVAIEKSRLHDELRQALAHLEASQAHLVQTERLKALAEMAGGLAHSFNNLLAVILGRAELLLNDAPDPRLERHLTTIQKTAVEAAEAVRRMQELTRIRRARPFEAVDLNDVLRGAVESTRWRWRDVAQASGASYELSIEAGTVPAVSGDPADLRDVLAALVVHALDAMPRGGRLTLATGQVDAWAQCAISDTGPGLTEEARQHLFDPQFPAADRRSFGAGLSVAYGIVARHGGDILVSSRPGQGTTLVVRLPMTSPEPARVAESAEAQPRQLRILVIDDEEGVREVVATLLRRDGNEVVLAANGWDGLARIREMRFDLILTDLGMPGLSGWDVARLVKDTSPTTPVALVTGWSEQLDPDEARRRQVDFLVAKPFTRKQLARVLGRVAAAATPSA